MQSLLFVFEVKVDYVEGNSRMIIYNNYVEVPQLWLAKKRAAQLVLILTKNLCCDRFRPPNASIFHVLTLGQGQGQHKQRRGSKDLSM